MSQIQLAVANLKNIITFSQKGRIIDAKSGYSTCIYAEGENGVVLKLIVGKEDASANRNEKFWKAVVNQSTIIIYVGTRGFAVSWSGKETDRCYSWSTLSTAFTIICAEQLPAVLNSMLAKQSFSLQHLLQSICQPRGKTNHRQQSADILAQVQNAFGPDLVQIPKGTVSKFAYCQEGLAVPVRVQLANNYGSTKERFTTLDQDTFCLYILYSSLGMFTVFSTDLDTKCPKPAELKVLHIACAYSTLKEQVSNLVQVQEDGLVPLDEIPVKATKSRQENTEQFGQNQLREMDVMQIVKAMMQNDVYMEIIQPGCKADAALRHLTTPKILGLQFKTSQAYAFHWCCGYRGMLLICKAAKDDNYLIIPGDIAIDHIVYTPGSARWSPYAVPETLLCQFLTKIFDAILAKQSEFTWPSGLIQDISQLQLVEPSELNKAVSDKGQLELDNIRARETLFPDFKYVYPETQTTVDVEINSVQVQDKVGDAEDANFWHVKIVKNAGNVDGKRQKKPYREGDYEALWVFNKNNQDFFLLPAAKLVEKGVLANATHSGKQWVSCVTPDYNGRGTQYAWTTKYYFKAPFGQEDRERLTALLESCRKERSVDQLPGQPAVVQS